MSDQDVATRAPENDAAEAPAEVTGASNEPSATDHCVTDRPTPAGQAPTGEISKLGDVDVYITKPSDYPHSPSKLLVLLSSGTGIHSTNNQIQADRYAAEGFLVVMPDMFEGDPAPNSHDNETQIPQGASQTLIEQFKLRAAETAKSFVIDMWLARHTSAKVLPILHKVIEATKEEFADAVANGGGVYAAGYCFGGKYVLILAGNHPDSVMWGQAPKDEEEGMVENGPLLKAGAIAHGTLVTIEDLTSLKAPVTMACVENDQVFPDDIREEGRKHLETNNIEHEIKVYSDVPHGFAVVGDYKESSIQEAQKQAFDQMLAWLQSH
ncbi:MAG: hypothetical protein M4579_000375 [Chaenotheca gracillima]|nr:MAG: hypothetical protein M4579_000375 [Chaenotheca gracillima]